MELKEGIVYMLEPAITDFNIIYKKLSDNVDYIWSGNSRDQAVSRLKVIAMYKGISKLEVIKGKVKYLNAAVNLTDDLGVALDDLSFQLKELENSTNIITKRANSIQVNNKRKEVSRIKRQIDSYLGKI